MSVKTLIPIVGLGSAFARVPLTRDFWDGASAPDAIGTEDLSLEWLARATQAPPLAAAPGADDTDDPAEIPADSVSMVSDASRRAATAPSEDMELPSGWDPAESSRPDRSWP